jgi:hypothetical protein
MNVPDHPAREITLPKLTAAASLGLDTELRGYLENLKPRDLCETLTEGMSAHHFRDAHGDEMLQLVRGHDGVSAAAAPQRAVYAGHDVLDRTGASRQNSLYRPARHEEPILYGHLQVPASFAGKVNVWWESWNTSSRQDQIYSADTGPKNGTILGRQPIACQRE